MIRKIVFIALALFFIGCESKTETPYQKAQKIVETIVSFHENLVRLSIHAIPKGETKSRIIACNVKKKIGMFSHHEDILAITEKKTTLLHEGNKIDITMPILDQHGQAIAATGVTLLSVDGKEDNYYMNQAHIIAQELSAKILNSSKPLW